MRVEDDRLEMLIMIGLFEGALMRGKLHEMDG